MSYRLGPFYQSIAAGIACPVLTEVPHASLLICPRTVRSQRPVRDKRCDQTYEINVAPLGDAGDRDCHGVCACDAIERAEMQETDENSILEGIYRRGSAYQIPAARAPLMSRDTLV